MDNIKPQNVEKCDYFDCRVELWYV